jgi:alpha-mannosidase
VKRKVHLVCNAHLDPVWLWEWPEGAAAALATFRTAARLGREFPRFVFNHNEAVLYRWAEAYEPPLWARIRDLVRDGRWHILGGWHLQPDCNLPSGEGFIRQIQLGRRYFRERFGVEPRTAVNLDPFGHSRGLVQILARCGYDSYLFCRPGRTELELPGDTFVWVGFDGSEVLAHRAVAHYNSRGGEARRKLEAWLESNPKDETSLLLWGVGNHGGGASRRDLQDLERFAAERPDVEAVHSTPEAFFADLAPLADRWPRVERSLNPWAVGCYTSMAGLKQGYRRLENELFSAEKMAGAAAALGLAPYPAAELDQARNDLAFAQFHDILPGSSVPAGEDGALRLIGHGLEVLSRVKASAFFALASVEKPAAGDEIPLLVFNPHPYRVTGTFEAEFQPAEPNEAGGFLEVRMSRGGEAVPCQVEKEQSTLSIEWRKRVAFHASLDPGAMNRFDCRLERVAGRPAPRRAARGRAVRLETPWGRVTISRATGLVDEFRVGEEGFLGAGALEPVVRRDDADSWAMSVRSFRRPAGRFRLLRGPRAGWLSGTAPDETPPVRIIEDGAVRTVVEALFAYGRSFLCQRYKVSKLDPEVEVETRVLWNEKDRLLKLRLPAPWREAVCLGRQAFGVEELSSNGEEAVAQRWAAIVSRPRNLALTVVNDRTYGLDFSAGEARLSLVRSPAYATDVPGGRTLKVKGRFLPRQDQGEHVFRFWLRGGAAGERLAAVDREALALNETPYLLPHFPAGPGRTAGPYAVLEGDAVQMTCFKRADEGEDLIIRLFEPTGIPRTARLILPWAGAGTEVGLRGFEVKTLRFERTGRKFIEVDLLERTRQAGRKERR